MSKTKKLLCLLMSIVMACTIFGGTVSAFAADSGVSGNWVYEVMDNGGVRITEYRGNSSIVSIPYTIAGKTVKAIGPYAFADNDRVVNVYLPLTMEAIEEGAFKDCDRLTFMTVTSKVDVIGDSAFENCDRLEWISIFSGLQSVGNRAFYDCDRLGSITLPKTVKSVGEAAFYSCGRMTSANLKGVETVGANAFYGCDRLKKVHFGSALESLGDRAFGGFVYDLTKVYFDGNAPELGQSVFGISRDGITIYHKIGNNTFKGGQWNRFDQKTFLLYI